MSTRQSATSSRSVSRAGKKTLARTRIARMLQSSGARGVLPTVHTDGLWYLDRAFTRPWKYPEDLEKQVEGVLDPSWFPVPVQYGPDLLNGWSGWVNAIPNIGSTVITGNVLRMTETEATTSAARFDSPGFPTVVGRKYKVTYRYKTKALTGNVFLRVGTTQGASNIGVGQYAYQGVGMFDFTASTTTTFISLAHSSITVNGEFSEWEPCTVQEVIEDWSWLGPELYVGGGFEVDTAGTNGTRCAVSRSTARAASGSASLLCTVNNNTASARIGRDLMVASKSYFVSVWVYLPSGQTVSGLQIVQGGVGTNVLGTSTTSTTNTWVQLTALVTALVTNIGVGTTNPGAVGDTFFVDDITVREIPGHPLIAPSAGAGVTPTARVNLLQRTEQIGATPWSNASAALVITQNAGVAPNGTNTASLLVPTTASVQHRLDQTPTSSAGTQVLAVFAKAAGYNFVSLRIGILGAAFNLSDGTWATTGAPPMSVSSVPIGNGWYKCSITVAAAANDIARINVSTIANVIDSSAGDGTSGILVWGADLRLAIYTGPAYPDYQRVGDGTAGVFDYDHVGFPVRLESQANGRGLRSAGTVNFSNTDALHSGVVIVKTSDAATGLVMETSVNLGANSGSIYLGAPTSNNFQEYTAASRGSSTALARTVNGIFPAPHIGALFASSDISDDTLNLSVNGTQAASSAADQGTGNYGDHVLNIAGRDLSGTPNLRFTGGLFGTPFIVDGNVVSAADAAEMLRDIARVAGHIY